MTALDAIDLQLAAGSDEVVLPRDAAVLVACALHDLPDLLAKAWNDGADFVARHPGMSAGYVRAANPYRQITRVSTSI